MWAVQLSGEHDHYVGSTAKRGTGGFCGQYSQEGSPLSV